MGAPVKKPEVKSKPTARKVAAENGLTPAQQRIIDACSAPLVGPTITADMTLEEVHRALWGDDTRAE